MIVKKYSMILLSLGIVASFSVMAEDVLTPINGEMCVKCDHGWFKTSALFPNKPAGFDECFTIDDQGGVRPRRDGGTVAGIPIAHREVFLFCKKNQSDYKVYQKIAFTTRLARNQFIQQLKNNRRNGILCGIAAAGCVGWLAHGGFRGDVAGGTARALFVVVGSRLMLKLQQAWWNPNVSLLDTPLVDAIGTGASAFKWLHCVVTNPAADDLAAIKGIINLDNDGGRYSLLVTYPALSSWFNDAFKNRTPCPLCSTLRQHNASAPWAECANALTSSYFMRSFEYRPRIQASPVIYQQNNSVVNNGIVNTTQNQTNYLF